MNTVAATTPHPNPAPTRKPLRSRTLVVDAAGLLACLAVAAGAYFLGVEPVTDARAQIDQKKRLIDEQTRNAADAEELVRHESARLSELKQQLDAVKVQLAPPGDLNKRLAVIAGLLESHGLVVQALDPGAPATDPDLGKFTMVPIRLAGSGSFAGVSAFLHNLLAKEFPDIEVRALGLTGSGITALEPLHTRRDENEIASSEIVGPPQSKHVEIASFTLELRWYAAPAASAAATPIDSQP